MNKSYVVGLIVVAVIAIIGVFTPAGEIIVQKLGSTPGLDNYNVVNFQAGIKGTSAGFVSTTTIACSIQNPHNGTSTIASVSFQTNKSTTTTTVLGLATSTNSGRYATSTALVSKTIAANALGTATYVPGSSANIIGPGEWILVGYGAGTSLPAVAQAQIGVCSALFSPI